MHTRHEQPAHTPARSCRHRQHLLRPRAPPAGLSLLRRSCCVCPPERKRRSQCRPRSCGAGACWRLGGVSVVECRRWCRRPAQTRPEADAVRAPPPLPRFCTLRVCAADLRTGAWVREGGGGREGGGVRVGVGLERVGARVRAQQQQQRVGECIAAAHCMPVPHSA
eukprot:3937450-Rhodomonas_salina.1